MRTLLQDLRYGLRRLSKSRGFTLVAVGALALGIGANTAIFSVVNAVLLRPLPYPEPEQLVQLWESRPRQNMARVESSPNEFLAWAEESQSFQQLAAVDFASFNLTGRGEPERVSAVLVTAGYFPLLGVAPELGRAFLAEEDQPGKNNVVVLSHDLWQNSFGSDPSVVNQTVSLDAVACTVVGVMPRGFRLPGDARLARPIAFTAEDRARAGSHFLQVFGRLKDGVTRERAEAELAGIAARLEQTFAATNVGHQIVIVPLHEQLVGDVRPALLVLLGAVGLVLLIACANLANLLLARAEARRKEVAVRAALGASRWRIVRQLLAESVLLSAAGGAAGLLLAVWGVDLLISLDPAGVRRVGEVSLDAGVLAFTVALSLATGVVFGLAPALQASKTDFVETLKEGGRSSSGGRRRSRLRSTLVASEVALTLVLLVGAGLLVKSFARLLEVDPGLDPRGVLTLDVSLPPAKYPERQQIAAFYEQLLAEVAALPGVEKAGAVNVLPLGGNDTSNFVQIEGRPPLPSGQALRAGRRNVGADYFGALRIPLKGGRAFAPSDSAEAPPVVVINEAMARAFFAGEDPIGRRIRTGDRSPWVTVVGVVGDVRHRGLDVETRPEMFFPHAQSPSREMTLAVRTAGDPVALVGPVRERVRAVDRDQPVGNVKTMEAWLAESVASRRFSVLLLAAFALVAAVLAALGIYGVVSYGVAQRTHELGLRIALGARRADVLRLVIRQGMKMTLVGAAVGLAASLALTRVMSGLLYGVSATDPSVYAAVSLLVAAVAFLACYVPARRATRVDPMEALRHE
ncbi:MAG TPA: ABC transporter permease [Pyrinomonadaceae bacterium]|nr:ABC transporter permease [Pyrinomonadaceae bacterium]